MKVLMGAFVTGVVFALGLGLSGMTDANKVIAFLNLAGQWDPSLAFVMVGAIGVHLVFYKLVMKRGSSLYGTEFETPPTNKLEKRLVIGSAIFGVGWALGGYCPGPAVSSMAGLSAEPLWFTGAMLAGMFVYDIILRKSPQQD